MSNRPFFSVVIPVFNGEKYISYAVDSVLNQSFSDYEIIIVNDCSTDQTMSVCQKHLVDERVNVITLDKNSGVAVARNIGIENCQGRYICFLDCDDVYLPNHLETLSFMIRSYPDEVFYFTSHQDVLLDGKIVSIVSDTDGKGIKLYSDYIGSTIDGKTRIHTNSVCVKREVFAEIGVFKIGIHVGEDIDLWNRIGLYHNVVVSDIVTTQRNRINSTATRHYVHIYEDCFDREIDSFLFDSKINEMRKTSLVRYRQEKTRSNINHKILDGDKRTAWSWIRSNDLNMCNKKRLFITYISFLLPTGLLNKIVSIKSRGFYHAD